MSVINSEFQFVIAVREARRRRCSCPFSSGRSLNHLRAKTPFTSGGILGKIHLCVGDVILNVTNVKAHPGGLWCTRCLQSTPVFASHVRLCTFKGALVSAFRILQAQNPSYVLVPLSSVQCLHNCITKGILPKCSLFHHD